MHPSIYLMTVSIRRHSHQYCLILGHFYTLNVTLYLQQKAAKNAPTLYRSRIFSFRINHQHVTFRYFACCNYSAACINISLFLWVSYIPLWMNCILEIYQLVNIWGISTYGVCKNVSMNINFIVNLFFNTFTYHYEIATSYVNFTLKIQRNLK